MVARTMRVSSSTRAEKDVFCDQKLSLVLNIVIMAQQHTWCFTFQVSKALLWIIKLMFTLRARRDAAIGFEIFGVQISWLSSRNTPPASWSSLEVWRKRSQENLLALGPGAWAEVKGWNAIQSSNKQRQREPSESARERERERDRPTNQPTDRPTDRPRTPSSLCFRAWATKGVCTWMLLE